MSDADLNLLRSAMAAFLSKCEEPAPATPAEAAGSVANDPSVAAGEGPPAGSPPPKTADKPGTAKKGKASAEPALPALATLDGQMAELRKWNSMLDTTSGLTLQDADCADWLASLLKPA